MTNTLDFLHQIIRRQTNALKTPVTNLFGAVADSAPSRAVTEPGAWRIVAVPQEVQELEDFFATYRQSPMATNWLQSTIQGALVYPQRAGLGGGNAPAASRCTYLAIGTVYASGGIILPVAVELDSQQSWAAAYIDGVLQRRAWGGLDLRMSLTAGQHQVCVLLNATQFGLATPESIRITGDDAAPRTMWDSITTTPDAVSGLNTVTLSWYNSSRAGGWTILRRTLTAVGDIVSVTATDTRGVFGCELSGDQVAAVSVGSDVVVGSECVGRVVSARYASGAVQTHLEIQLADQMSGVPGDWAGQLLSTAQIAELASVRRLTSAAKVTWAEAAVSTGMREYALQAFGMFDPSVRGPLSEYRQVWAGDSAPPASIVFVSAYPRIINRRVVARFTTPADSDYAGVHVYYEDVRDASVPNPATTGAGTGLNTLADSSKAWAVTQPYVGCICEILSGASAGLRAVITSMTDTQLVVDGDWYIPITDTPAYRILRYTAVLTDYGLPGTLDELTFEPIGTGVYQFRAFDLAGNEQLMADCAAWTAWAISPPQTTLTTQDIDVNGLASSSTVAILLGCYPEFTTVLPPYAGAPITSTGSNTDSTLNDTGAFVNQAYNEQTANYVRYYVRLLDGSGRARQITSNDANTLQVTPGWGPPTPGAVGYEIVDGATLVRWGGVGSFSPVFQTRYQQRPPVGSDLLVDFYTELTGFPAEPVKRVRIDADTTPRCTALTLTEDPANNLRINVEFDDDVREWWVYARKGNWPTTGATPVADGPLAAQYLRCQHHVTVTDVTMFAANGTWYVIVLPVSSLTELGVRATDSKTVSGVPDTTAALVERGVAPHDHVGVACYNRLVWTHNAAAELSGTPANDAVVRIWAYRNDRGESSKVELTTGTRYAWQDSEHPSEFSNDNDDTNETVLAGSFLHALTESRGNSVTNPYRTWYYEIRLYQPAGTPLATYYLTRSEYLSDPTPLLGTVTATETETGAGAINDA